MERGGRLGRGIGEERVGKQHGKRGKGKEEELGRRELKNKIERGGQLKGRERGYTYRGGGRQKKERRGGIRKRKLGRRERREKTEDRKGGGRGMQQNIGRKPQN
jgi:hypothetical protein